MSAPNISNSNLEYFDGFEDYSITQYARYWNIYSSSAASLAISSGNGRNSSSSLRASGTFNASNPTYLTLTLSQQATRTIGFAVKLSVISTYDITLVALYDGTTIQLDLRVKADGTLYVTRNGTTVASSTLAISAGIWYYIEFSSTINNTTGSVTVKVNTATYINSSSLNTRNTSNNYVSNVYFGVVSLANGAGNVSPTIDFDDLYIRKDSTFLGDIRVESKLPNANGSTNQWTPLSGSNFTNVADNPADDNTSYNSTATVGNIDLFSYPALTSSGTIYAVMLCPVAEIDTSGVGQIQPVYNISSTNYTGPTSYPSSNSYNSFPDIQGQNPGTSAAWTTSDITSTQFGLERTA